MTVLNNSEGICLMIQWCEEVFAPFLLLMIFAYLSHFHVSDHGLWLLDCLRTWMICRK